MDEKVTYQVEAAPLATTPVWQFDFAGRLDEDHRRATVFVAELEHDGHRIAQRKAAPVARRGHVDPGQFLTHRKIGQIGAQPPGFGQERGHRNRLPQRQEPERRRRRDAFPDQVR